MREAKPDPLSIFETREDHVSWDKYDHQNNLIEGLTDDERQRARAGMQYLRGLLGEDFLRRAVETGNPIFSWFFANAAPHARRSLIRLAEELKAFANGDGFNSLIARLKDSKRAAEALTVLGVSSSFSQVGFIISFDPDLEGSRRVPDLLIVDPDSGEEIYIEVSRLRSGGQREVNRRSYDAIWSAVHDAIWQCPGAFEINAPKVQPYVQILRPLSENDLPDAVNAIRTRIFDSARTGEYFEFKFKDSIEMAVSPPSDHSKAKAWAASRNMRDFVEAPPINLERELKKAIDKIHDEMRQIPAGRPGIIAIPTSESLLFFFFHPEQIILEIAEEVRRYRNLLCVLLFHGVMEGHQESTIATLGEHAFVTTMNDLSTERTAFVMNDSFGLSLSKSTIDRVRKAFVPH